VKRFAVAAAAMIAVAPLLEGRPALASTRLYVLAIGNNAPPADADPRGESLPTLHYSDDDAAAFFTYTRDASEQAELLTVLDARSQERFPNLAQVARPPTLAELRLVVARYRARFEADRLAGDDPVLLFFFSGHGTRSGDHPASLVLLDGPLTQSILYDEFLAALPARYVHLIVDACYAEAVIRPRDGQSESVVLSPSEMQRIADRRMLSRFPNVGAMIATSTAARAFEWDAIERGVFTHELLSGLRGAADVNADGRVDYDELYAFLAAANRDVSDPRARLTVIEHPPPLDRQAPIFDLATLRGGATLVGTPAPLGRVSVEDDRGNRILDVNAEPGFRVTLHVPEGHLYVHAGSGEAQVDASPGSSADLGSLTFSLPRLTHRGAVEGALERGLFSARFGPGYFGAFVDGLRESTVGPVPGAEVPGPAARGARTAGWVTLGVAGALAGTTAVLTGLTFAAKNDYEQTSLEREATSAKDRYMTLAPLSVVAAGATLVTAALGTFLVVRGDAKRASTSGGLRPYSSDQGIGAAW
jgi:Caspase domain